MEGREALTMPEAALPGRRRARSMTVAGIVDVVIGGLGLVVGGLVAAGIGLALAVVVVMQRSTIDFGDPPSPVGGISAAGTLLMLGPPVLFSVLADAWLLATGIQLLRRTRGARRSAIVYACLVVPLGVIDCALAGSHVFGGGWILRGIVLLMPAYALVQVIACFVVPSWRASLDQDSPSAPATG
jgi:hypothetical protein